MFFFPFPVLLSESKIFEALNNFTIRMISYGGSSHNISILIPTEEKKEVLQALHTKLWNG